MDWKKWSGKAAEYAADGAVEKTAEFALTKVGPYRVAGIIAKLLMFAAVLLAVGAWSLHAYLGYVGTASALYVIAVLVFAVGLVVNMIRNYIFNKAKGALKTGVDWASDEVKKRYLNDANGPQPVGKGASASASMDPAFGIDAGKGKSNSLVDPDGPKPVK